jgi:hypothetical protein
MRQPRLSQRTKGALHPPADIRRKQGQNPHAETYRDAAMADPTERNVTPKTQVQTANPGHPPPLNTFPEKYRSDIRFTSRLEPKLLSTDVEDSDVTQWVKREHSKGEIDKSGAMLIPWWTDPARQLREAGYPFDHISTELTTLHGKFEVVSKDVMLLKETIANEANRLSGKVDESQRTVLEKVEMLFDRKFMSIAGAIIGCLAIMYGAVTFLQTRGVTGAALGATALIGGFGILAVVYLLARRKQSKQT